MNPGPSIAEPPRGDVKRTKVSVRVPAESYLTASLVCLFFFAFASYLEVFLISYILLFVGVVLLPLLALSDRLVFNGRRIFRTGVMPNLWAYLKGSRLWLKSIDVESVETMSSASLKRPGKVYLRHRTTLRGQGLEFSLVSGGNSHRRFIRELLGTIPEDVMDPASIELRDYLREPRLVTSMARKARIPSAEVLENTLRWPGKGRPSGSGVQTNVPEVSGREKEPTLRVLGNQLRLAGSHLQAMESFRRAARLRPDDPWILLDTAKCLYSMAVVERDAGLERKAAAMLRLAERRAGTDARLLTQLGESYFQIGEGRRAINAFRKAVETVGEQFRSIRGLAEVSLFEGRLAHVVHNLGAASRLASSPGARRWSIAEADYFSRLSSDAEYMELELGRVNLLDSLARWRRFVFKLCLMGLPVIMLGLYLNDAVIANAGWTLSALSLVLWVLIQLGLRAFSPRIILPEQDSY
ncbi:MAG: hypothetical protein IPM25_05930 [Chloracidobacterium sp.]|nr:hypothetical protein [Chloracidobacterium sp.]